MVRTTSVPLAVFSSCDSPSCPRIAVSDGGPLDRLEERGRRVEALQRDGAIRRARGHVELANQLRISRRLLPAIVARGEARGQALGGWRGADSDRRLELEEHVGERQLAIEILGEASARVLNVVVMRSRSASLMRPSQRYCSVASSAISPSMAAAMASIGGRNRPGMRRV